MRAVTTLDCCHVVLFIIFSYLKLVFGNMVLANYGRDIFFILEHYFQSYRIEHTGMLSLTQTALRFQDIFTKLAK